MEFEECGTRERDALVCGTEDDVGLGDGRVGGQEGDDGVGVGGCDGGEEGGGVEGAGVKEVRGFCGDVLISWEFRGRAITRGEGGGYVRRPDLRV